MDYTKNVELALHHGYEEVIDENAYKGRYFVKDGKIWIHDIDALKIKMGVLSDDDLRPFNYQVDLYYKYRNYTNEMVNNEMKNLYEAITHCDGEATYLSDGVWLYPDGHMEER